MRWLLALLLCGCVAVPSKERPFCLPQVKHHKLTKKTEAGIRCRF